MEDRTPNVPPKILPIADGIARPVWSVMIPTYNCINYVKEVLESVLIQDLGTKDMQIEVVDDCSTDGNVEELVKKIGKGRVQFYKQKTNRGSLRNFETCINRAKGKYIHILHGDDRVEQGYYQEVSELFGKCPEAGAAFTNFFFIDRNGDKLDLLNEHIINESGIVPDILLQIAHRQLLQPPSIVVKRSVYEHLGSFYAVHFGEDWEMWARIASKYPIAFTPKYLAGYRVAQDAGISHNCFLTGQNIKDIEKVINIIQTYLPTKEKAFLKKRAKAYYALYCIKIANNLLLDHTQAALFQAKGAWGMSKSLKMVYWMGKFYLMYFFRYKKIRRFLNNNLSHKKSIDKKDNVQEQIGRNILGLGN